MKITVQCPNCESKNTKYVSKLDFGKVTNEIVECDCREIFVVQISINIETTVLPLAKHITNRKDWLITKDIKTAFENLEKSIKRHLTY